MRGLERQMAEFPSEDGSGETTCAAVAALCGAVIAIHANNTARATSTATPWSHLPFREVIPLPSLGMRLGRGRSVAAP